ncbi:phosphatase PAP2 family protein [Novosphingobium sp. AP12]|uniref:acid phosphatase n=1 Tax=Novosphingobium sp. AP12 TaxID=1144305 RepID=UPI000271E26A|nr:phosphatase PAP2 family protein [Novosphingobium sp. AP12]EJL27213.1 membrane-associated phospholipid phosphatase [Novosphingobium sp. AP12]
MKVRLSIAAAVTATVLITASAVSNERPKGYLAADEFDVTHIVEPAPRPGDPRYETDRKIFKATRKLVDTPRWKLATEDADYSVPALARDFSCAVGVKLTPQNAPKLMMLIERAGADTSAQSSKAKAVYQRHRPFTIDKGRICQPESELYDEKKHRMSYDYPSGHTTWGWTWALVLSSIAPDRAQQILERGRAYGDSRFVCGAHNESAVEAGMLSATATMALVQTKPEYQADREAAKAELDALRHSGEQPTACEAEALLLNQRVMPRF